MKKLLFPVLAVAAALVGNDCRAQDWQPQVDRLSSGAAASIALYFLCEGGDHAQERSDEVGRILRQRVGEVARNGSADGQAVTDYALDAVNLKIKALWQANSDRSCDTVPNLRALARGMGFPVPR